MDFFLYAIIISILYVYSGIGLIFLVIPKKFEKYSFYLSPFAGLAYLSYFSWLFFEYSPWGTNTYAKILFIPPLFFLIFACIIKKDRIVVLFSPFKKENLPLIFLCIILFLALSFPYYSKIDGISNTITLGNNDIIDYAAKSKYLMVSSILQSPLAYVPEVAPSFPWILQNTYFSAAVSTALPSSLLHLESYQIQNLVIYLFFIFSLPISYLIGIEIFGYSKKIAFILTLLIGINFHLLYIVYQGFFGQCVGIGFMLGLIFSTYYPILKYEKFSEIIPFLPLNVLFCFGLFISYNILVPLFLIPALLFLSLYFIYSRSKPFLVHSVGYFSLTFFITFLISPFSFINRIVSLFWFNDVIAGWDMPVLSPDQIFGLVGNNVWMQPEPVFLRILLSLPIILLLIFSLYFLFKKERREFFLFGSYLGFVIIFYCYLFIKESLSPSFSGDGYKAYKLFTYFIPIFLLTGFYYFKNFEFTFTQKNFGKKIAIIAFLCLIIMGNIWSAFAIISGSAQQSAKISNDIISLEKINYIENISSINVEENAWWEQMWIYYFLMGNKSVYLKYPTYYGSSPQKGEWTLKTKSDIIHINNQNDSLTINGAYYLVKNVSLDTTYTTGWYDRESNGPVIWRWSGANNESSSILLDSTQDQRLNLDLRYWSLNPANVLTVLIDNNTIKDCIDRQYCGITNINLTSGNHILTLRTKLPPQLPGNGDPRYLGYAFSNITFSSTTQN
jgi:signal peptidase I